MSVFFKMDPHLPKQIVLFILMKSLLKMLKNASYFILIALFVFKIFEFLSLRFGQIEKTDWLERKG